MFIFYVSHTPYKGNVSSFSFRLFSIFYVLNIQRDLVSSLSLIFFFFNITSYEMTGNMGSDYILTGSLLFQQPHIILDCVGNIFYVISKTLFQL